VVPFTAELKKHGKQRVSRLGRMMLYGIAFAHITTPSTMTPGKRWRRRDTQILARFSVITGLAYTRTMLIAISASDPLPRLLEKFFRSVRPKFGVLAADFAGNYEILLIAT
jgi:hypothetical protein